MTNGSRLCFGLICALLAACAQQRTVYQPPQVEHPTPAAQQATGGAVSGGKSIVVGARDAAWQRLLKRVAAQRLAVERTDQESGRIMLRYRGDPLPHVDCGTVTTKVVRAEGEASYSFPGAVAQQRYEIRRNGAVYSVDRQMALDAQIDVRFKPLDARRTRVIVATMYRLKRDQTVQGRSGKPMVLSDTIGFSSDADATFANAPTRCEATGRLEQVVLNLLRS